MDIIESIIDRRAFGLASDLAEARSHRPAGRLHDLPGQGGCRRRCAGGSKAAVVTPVPIGGRCRFRQACRAS